MLDVGVLNQKGCPHQMTAVRMPHLFPQPPSHTPSLAAEELPRLACLIPLILLKSKGLWMVFRPPNSEASTHNRSSSGQYRSGCYRVTSSFTDYSAH